MNLQSINYIDFDIVSKFYKLRSRPAGILLGDVSWQRQLDQNIAIIIDFCFINCHIFTNKVILSFAFCLKDGIIAQIIFLDKICMALVLYIVFKMCVLTFHILLPY